MITNDDILNMNFYKKERFTGSYLGMRYLIRKDSEETKSPDDDAPVSSDIFRVTAWPGPYNFATTPDDKKVSVAFPFTPEGKQQVVDWLNEHWNSKKEEWPQ